jgi:hypothetical protein
MMVDRYNVQHMSGTATMPEEVKEHEPEHEGKENA